MKAKTAFFLSLLWLACAPTPERQAGDSESAAQGEFVLEVTKGGGVAGLYKTYRLHENGTVEFRQRIGLSDSLLWERSADKARVVQLRDELLATGALQQALNERGNMTASALYAAASDTVRWSWDAGREAPEALGSWYRQVWSFCAEQAP